MSLSLITGPFLGGDMVVMQWGPDSPWPLEWSLRAAFSTGERHEASEFANSLRRRWGRPVLILRTVDLNGTLAIVDEAPARAEAA
jgi:hypothetical protein